MKRKAVLFLISGLLCLGFSFSRNNADDEKAEVTKLSQNLYKIRFGNINLVASVGPDGVLLSDTGFAHMADKIRAEVKKLGSDDVKIVINTHWHSDHTDGNKAFGREATIIAHQSVRKLLSEKQVSEYWDEGHDPLPEYARPYLTFSDALNIHFNGEDIELTHFPESHSDGDVIVHFKRAGVVHLGDLLFSDGFPAVDFENGGNAAMWAKSLQKIIEMMPEDVIFVAGHGRDYTLEDLKKYQNMMQSTVEIVHMEMDRGRSLADIKNAGTLKDWEKWGKAVFPCDKWIEMVYHSLGKSNEVKIIYYGHSCFEFQYSGKRILVDPFTPEWFDYEMPKGKIDYGFASHEAKDHSHFEGLDVEKRFFASGASDQFECHVRDEISRVKGKISEHFCDHQFTFWTVPSFHDDVQGARNGVNGIMCFDFGGVNIVHLGDIGHRLKESQVRAIGEVDILMVPVDSYYIVELETAREIVNQLSPRIVIPMHYKTDKSHSKAYADDLGKFINMFEKVKRNKGSQLRICADDINDETRLFLLDYKSESLKEKRLYLGQKPPGMKPEVFAPGIISTEAHEYSMAVSKELDEILFTRRLGEYSYIYSTMFRKGKWIAPKIAPFSGKFSDYDQCFHPEGSRLFFASDRPRTGNPFIGDIWFVEKSAALAGGWGKAKSVGSPVNTEVNEACPTVARNGNIYFHAVYPRGEGEADIYCAEFVDGKYITPKKLSSAVNTKWGESNAFIAPDESYIVFGSSRPGGFGAGDLYISFRAESGEWTKAVNMGNEINTSSSEYCPSVSPDGKYLFFTRIVGSNPRQGDIFWVRAPHSHF
jgi:glyoxylase-like metal-dependent hydrolase (beta-lactamase superfamily II)